MLSRGETNPLITDPEPTWGTCVHGFLPGLCKECFVDALEEKKTGKKKTHITVQKQRSRSQENRISKGYEAAGFKNSKRVTMSGALADMKGDVDPGEMLLVEAKETRTGKMVIDPEWLAKVQDEAHKRGRRWYALHAWVAKDNEHFGKVVCVDEELWWEVLTAYKQREENDQNSGL